jgi:hypothetical protein
VTGGINRNGPPYRFRIHKIITGNKGMKEIEDAVEEIAKESIEDNGGEIEIN